MDNQQASAFPASVYREQVARWTHESVVDDPVGTVQVPILPPV